MPRRAVARYGALALVLAAAAMVLVFVVGLSRVVLGVHWLSDVVAGWALPIGWLSFLAAGVRIRALREGR